MKDFPIFPWERDEKPYFINEMGFEWYVDKFATKWAHDDVCLSAYHTRKGIKNVVAFFVKNGDEIRSVLIDEKQEVVAEAENTIGLCHKIDKLKIYYDFATFDDLEKDREAKKYLMEVCSYISE
jgi:hypothetical protein